MTEKVRYGPAYPYPLSQLKTELVWQGKCDEYRNCHSVDIAGCATPMQKIDQIYDSVRKDSRFQKLCQEKE